MIEDKLIELFTQDVQSDVESDYRDFIYDNMDVEIGKHGDETTYENMLSDNDKRLFFWGHAQIIMRGIDFGDFTKMAMSWFADYIADETDYDEEQIARDKIIDMTRKKGE